MAPSWANRFPSITVSPRAYRRWCAKWSSTSLIEPGELIIDASVARHLALAPVAFAVTEGIGHRLIYANAAFTQLQADGEIGISSIAARGPPATDLKSLLDEVSASGTTMHDIVLKPAGA